MTVPLTFGVEFEFALAYLPNDSTPLPHPDDAKKIIRITPTEEDWERNLRGSSQDEFRARATRFAAKRSVRNTIREAGFPVSDGKALLDECDFSKWEVVEDATIDGPERTPYEWTDIEVRSPAFFFTRGSLKAVADVAILLNKTFGIHVNRTMGLHVHIGDSTKGFDKITISNLIAFLWAFEPQLNSLHPIYRQNQTWGQSMREVSTYAMEYRKKYGRRPHSLTGVLHFLEGNSTYNLIKDAAPASLVDAYKYCAYSFQGLVNKDLGFDDSKPTIEFRQHAATMDTEAIVNWIETSVGIVEYIRNIDNATLMELLRIVEHESWEKLGDGKDDEREARLGPILAESKFTIIDLLQAMELYGPANYYRNRWRKLPKQPPLSWSIPEPDIIWEYEDLLDPESAEFKRKQCLRENWEADRIASEAQPEGGWKFDPDHPSWPLHRHRGDPPYTPQLTTVHKLNQYKSSSERASFVSNEQESAAGDEEANSFHQKPQACRPLRQLSWSSAETEEESYEVVDSPTSASIPNHSKPAPSSPPFRSLSDLSFSSADASSHPDAAELAALDEESAALDRELSAYEPLPGADPQTEDRLWRERVRHGWYNEKDMSMQKGDGVVVMGCRDPFDESLPRTDREPESPQVSPKSK